MARAKGSSARSARPARMVRLLRRTALALLLTLVFVFSLIAGAVLHLGLPLSKLATASLLERFLDSTFEGSFEVGAIDQLSGQHARATDLIVKDPDGRVVLRIARLDAEVDAIALLERVLTAREVLSITLERVTARDCEVEFLRTKQRDAQGRPLTHVSLADAFTPVQRPPANKARQSRRVRVWLPTILLRDIYARGQIENSPILEARIPLARSSLLATDRGVAVDVMRFGVQASGFSGVDTTAQGEIHVRVPGAVWGDVSGTLGQVPLAQKFRVENGILELTGHYPKLAPRDLRPLLGTWPLDRTIAVDVHIKGPPDALRVQAEVHALDGQAARVATLSAQGEIGLAPKNRAQLEVSSQALDLSAFLSQLPNSQLDSHTLLQLDWSGGPPRLKATSTIDAGRVSQLETPTVQAEAQWTQEGWTLEAQLGAENLAGRLHAAQAGDGPLSFQLQLPPTVVAQAPRLREALGPLRGVLSGTLQGSYAAHKLEADLELHVEQLTVSSLRAQSAQYRAQLSGSLDQPLLLQATGRVSATRVMVGKVGFSSVDLSHSGPVSTPELSLRARTSNGVDLQASATAAPLQSTLTNVQAELSPQGQPVVVAIQRIEYGASRLLLEAFSLQSVGRIEGNVLIHPAGARIDVHARQLSVSRLSDALGLSRGELEGDLDADVDLTLGDDSRGSVQIEVSNAAALGFRGMEFSTSASIQGRDIDGKLHATVGNVGAVRSSWQARLAGPALQLPSYSQAEGKLDLTAENLDFSTLSLLLSAPGGPQVSGHGAVALHVERKRNQAPHGSLTVSTSQLEVSLPAQNFKTRGIDVELVSAIPAGGDHLEAALRIVDPYGPLLSLSGSVELPLGRWAEQTPAWDQLLQDARAAELSVVALLPDRKISRLPLFVPRFVDEGKVSVRATLNGTLLAPNLHFVLTGTDWFGGQSPLTEPLRVHASARYQAASGDLLGSVVLERDQNQFCTAQFDVDLHPVLWRQLLGPAGIPDPAPEVPAQAVPLWTGSAQLFLESSPLPLLRTFQDWGLTGQAQGTFQIVRKDYVPELHAELSLRRVGFRENDLGDALLALESHENDLIARLTLQDDSGTLHVSGEAGMVAGPLLVRPDERRSARLSARAERYDSAVLLPLLSDWFEEFSGPLVGTATAELRHPTDPSAPPEFALAGQLQLTGGLVTPSVLGTRLKDVHARLEARSQPPYNIIELSQLGARAEASSENVTGHGQLRFKNLSLESGSFEVRPERMPLYTGGTKLALLTGSVQGRFAAGDEELRMKLVSDTLTAELAATGESGLISLAENPNIEIVQARVPQQSHQQAPDSKPVVLELTLGQNIRVKNELLDIRIRGTPELRIAEQVSIGGAVELVRGGRFVVLGRSFLLERGLLLFDTNDPSDPHVQAVADWKAPSGVLVTVTVGGTLQAPTLNWSSEPALPGGEPDIIALVLGGGPGGGDSSVGGTPLAIAANELANVEGLEFYATTHTQGGDGRVSSLNDANWDSYTAAYQISDELWFEGSFQTGTAGFQSDAQSGVSGTLDWRFHPQWSARTQIGTLGAGLDMLWQYRY